MSTTKKVAYTGVGIALYVVLSMMAKIPVIAHISLDLGYLAFAVYLYHIGTLPGTIVGTAGCIAVPARMGGRPNCNRPDLRADGQA